MTHYGSILPDFRFKGELGVLFCKELQQVLLGMVVAGVFWSSATHADTVDEEDTTVRFQSTYVWQKKPGFNALYSGPNSLSSTPEKSYTATLTGFWGFRPWQGGELYFNPELTQGVPFSGLTGAAGFTNGELTRTASAEPHLYRQKLFLRQTWGLGGGEEKVESDLNQMAGMVDKNRVVLTVGNFSTLDVFDDNAYAKDPRTQFMNAGFMTYLAYDYAADARGFGYGLTLEWYQDDWVYRVGRMTGPKQPNMLPTDFRIFKYYGDQAEVEHSHTLFGQPGKIRILGWRNYDSLASFSDALNYLEAHPGTDPQTIFDVRKDHAKYGLGVNVEQAINDDVGVFMRAMKSDGKTETEAFTETDGSLSLGAVTKGTRWGRAKDTVGVGYLVNSISSERRNYLAAGGISFFLGDGNLNYAPEREFEIYYSMNVWKDLYVTADYQHMWNPGYNADRGPVDFGALRFHVEF
jgi:high affinity Mn2+ porin